MGRRDGLGYWVHWCESVCLEGRGGVWRGGDKSGGWGEGWGCKGSGSGGRRSMELGVGGTDASTRPRKTSYQATNLRCLLTRLRATYALTRLL